ncbi:CaiB/BaiF CoA transferase family protein [Paraconexibacter sp.]|uniref:CaiB/BaiF CoA transferase family protein n=1 Tax=Paraconexibacter sp. TaxID=2949640 RepID=UPI003562B9CD
MTWPPADDARGGPLAGVRVLDLSRILAGPFSTQVLADLGADVIKVERGGTDPVGDDSRHWGPPWAPSGDSSYFYACNRGRRAMLADLRVDADRDLVLRLVDDAHVLMENFLPGTMERLGLSDEVLHARNPRLVHAVISGYGHDSSRAAWPALDFVVQAHTGVLSVTGPDAATPTKAGLPIADLSAGLFATVGVLAALRRAEQTGVGGRVEVSLAEACGALLSNQALNHLIGGATPRAMGNAHPNVAPYQVVRAADRGIAIAAASDLQFGRLCAVLDSPALASDPRFTSNALRVEHREVLVAEIERLLGARTAAEWVVALNEAGVAAAVINTVPEMFADPDTRAGLLTSVTDEEGREVPQLRTPIRLDGVPLDPAAAPPGLGRDDAAIRAALAER